MKKALVFVFAFLVPAIVLGSENRISPTETQRVTLAADGFGVVALAETLSGSDEVEIGTGANAVWSSGSSVLTIKGEPGSTVTVSVRRRAASSRCRVLFEDLDGDGYGNPLVFRNSCDPSVSTVGWTVSGSDCNDKVSSVFAQVQGLYPDCDLDGYADDFEPKSVCVGELKPVIFVCPNASDGMCATLAYVDASTQQFWRPLSALKTDKDGKPIPDPTPGCDMR